MSEEIDSTNEYFKKIKDVTQELDREQMAKLWTRVKKGDNAARQRMLELNLRLVIPAAKRFKRDDVDFLDLVEEGNLGLLQAIDKFDPKKGFRFSTYAIYWIEQYIRKYMEEQSGAIKVPSHAWGDIKKWSATWVRLRAELGHEPSLSEMADELGFTARKIKSLLETINAAKGVDSLALTVGEDEEATLEDTLTDDGKGNPDDLFSKTEDNSDLLEGLNELDPRDKKVLIMRHGLDGGEPQTLGEVAEYMKLSRERIRQIEERAVNMMRKKARRMGFLETVVDDRRTKSLHTGQELKHKTNVLGEITHADNPLARLFKKRQAELKAKAAKTTSTKTAKKTQKPAAKTAVKKATSKAIKKVSKTKNKK